MKYLISLFVIIICWTPWHADAAPKVEVRRNGGIIGQEIADKIVDLIKENNRLGKKTVLGLSTGSSPIPVYDRLRGVFLCDPTLDLSKVVTFNLDEYVGLPPEHPQSYHTFMFTHLFTPDLLKSPTNPRGIPRQNIHLPDPNDPEGYEQLIAREGPIQLQILGIGENGHIAFCEPGAPFDGRTSVVELDTSTCRANSRFFDGDSTAVPTQAVSMGIGTICEAEEIVLIATGEKKAKAVKMALQGAIDSQVPASILQTRDNVTVWVDPAAGAGLKKVG